MRKIPRSAAELIETLQWSEHMEDRLMSEHPSGFFVIIPKDVESVAPIFCSVCGCALSTVEDVKCHDSIGSCEHCRDKFFYQNREKWHEGWRPAVDNCVCAKIVIIDHDT